MNVTDLTPEARYGLIRSRAQMSLPFNASCKECGDVDPLHLERRKRPILCRDCDAVASGKRRYEEHHLGRRPSPVRTVPITPNLHADLTHLQELWRYTHTPGSVYAVAFDAGALWAHQQLNNSD